MSGDQGAGSGDGDRFGQVALSDVQVAGGLGASGQAGEGFGEVGEIVPVAEGRDGCGQVCPGDGGVPGGQSQAAQSLVTAGQIGVPAVLSADVGIAAGQVQSGAGPPSPDQPLRPQDPEQRVQVLTSVSEVYLVGGSEVIVIALFVLMFFGSKQIPELMRGLGKGMREMKDAMALQRPHV